MIRTRVGALRFAWSAIEITFVKIRRIVPFRRGCPSVHAELCGASRVGMLRAERFCEMRQCLFGGEARGVVCAAAFFYTRDRKQ